ncbi:MAG: tail fiber assembly protein [Plesiomonas sp.]|uniref:tail fiber assembly protein n=1 Tax=Plesiomonas sp. TaxID=2486279 RepID=UPI003F2EF4A7
MNEFSFSDKDRTIPVYGYLADTGEYIGKSDCYIPANTGLPLYCTHIAAPLAPEGMAVVFDKPHGDWSIVEDHRGKMAYSTSTREPQLITVPGALAEGLTLKQPRSEFDHWVVDVDDWVKDENAEATFIQNQAAEQKARLFAEASQRIDVLTDKVNLGIAEDEKSLRAEIEAWRIYRAKLDDIDSVQAPGIEWPTRP